MPDLLVKLYNLPTMAPALERPNAAGIEIRQAHPAEKHPVVEWVRRNFWETWANECEAAFDQRPVTCYIAVTKVQRELSSTDPYDLPEEILLGFACYDVTNKGLFGPMGVNENLREHGIGKALLLACLHAMVMHGYAYAVIGWAGPVEFYVKTVGATVIEGSEPGMNRGKLKID